MNPLIVSIVGMTVIFLGIICIVMIIYLISLLCRSHLGRDESQDSDSEKNETITTENKGSISGDERQKLIAVISAAISAATDLSLKSMRIRSIKRIGNESAESFESEDSGRGEKIAAMSAAIAVAGGMSSESFRIVSIRKK